MTTTTQVKPYFLTAGTGLADLWWKTGRVHVKTTGAETGGRFAQIETNDPRGTATPMHVHHQEDEAFLVLDGEVTLVVDGGRIDVGPGDFALVPRGVAHGYVVRSAQARMLVTFSPAGFEDAFLDMGIAAGDGGAPPVETVLPSPEEMVRAFARYGCEITGPPPSV